MPTRKCTYCGATAIVAPMKHRKGCEEPPVAKLHADHELDAANARIVREQDGAIQLYRAELGEYSDQVRDLIATNDDLRTELARLRAYAESIEDAKNHRTEAAEKRVKEQDEELGQLRLEVDAQIALREAAEKGLEGYKETRLKLLETERDNGLLRDKFDEMSCAYGDLVADRDAERVWFWNAALAIGREEGRRERTELDYRLLRDKLTEVVAQGLHYTENIEKINTMKTAMEVSAAIDGGLARYRSDHIYYAKVQSFVAQLLRVIPECFEKGEKG